MIKIKSMNIFIARPLKRPHMTNREINNIHVFVDVLQKQYKTPIRCNSDLIDKKCLVSNIFPNYLTVLYALRVQKS